jgi:N-acetylglucosaminyl-diphospho-decaprenol L-rhamnosyltransferase
LCLVLQDVPGKYLTHGFARHATMDVSAVTVHYDCPHLLPGFFRALASSAQPPRDVTVVDNGPPGALAGARAVLAGTPQPFSVTWIDYAPNRGFAAACNAGAACSSADIVIFVNPDVLIGENVILELAAVLTRNPQIAIVAPMLIRPDGTAAQAYGSDPTLLRLILDKPLRALARRLSPSLREPLLGRFSPKYQNKTTAGPVDWVSGAVLMCRRTAWQVLGGFDEEYPLYYEDIDLCRRARLAGWQVWLVPEVSALHQEGGTQWRPGIRSHSESLYFQSQEYYFKKHHGGFTSTLIAATRRLYQVLGLRRLLYGGHAVQGPVDPEHTQRHF